MINYLKGKTGVLRQIQTKESDNLFFKNREVLPIYLVKISSEKENTKL